MRRRLLAALLGTLLALALAEGLARVLEARRPAAPPPSASLAFRPHALLGYELVPGHVRRGRESIGPHGFRGRAPALPKPEGVRRVLCLGGSTTYGDGLADGETYPEQLEALLAADGGAPAEVLNLGVPAYTTAESLLNLCLKGLDYEPDAVVVYHAVNDFRPRTLPSVEADYRSFRRVWVEEELERTPLAGALERSALARLVRGREVARHGLFALVEREVPVRLSSEAASAADTAWVFERNLRAIVDVARGRGIAVVLATQALDDAAIADPRDRAGIDQHNELTRRVAGEGGAVLCEVARDFPREGNFMPGDPVHLTAAGSAEQARRVRAALRSGAALERPAPRVTPPQAEARPALERLDSPLARDERAALAEARVLCPVPYQGHDLVPGAAGPGTLGPHDAHGFRGATADAAALTVAVLGGASAYGLGVAEVDATPRRLEALLREAGLDARVVDAGVPGHTSAQSLVRLHLVVLPRARPDVVVFAWDVEDALALAAPGFRGDYGHLLKGFREREPAGARALLERAGREGRDPLGVGAPLRELRPAAPAYDAGALARPAGAWVLERNLRTAVDLARGAGARAVLLRRACGETSPAVRRAVEAWNAAAERVAADTGAELADALSGSDPAAHFLAGGWLPSPAGHAQRAAALARVLLGSGG